MNKLRESKAGAGQADGAGMEAGERADFGAGTRQTVKAPVRVEFTPFGVRVWAVRARAATVPVRAQ